MHEPDDVVIAASTPALFMTADPFDRITTFLDVLRRRLDRRDAGESAWAVTIALSVGLVLGLALALVLGRGPGRWGCLFVTVGIVAAGWAHWRLYAKPRRSRATQTALARWLERRLPVLRSGVITAVQAGEALRDDLPWPGLCEPLARESAEATARHLGKVDLDGLVDTHRLRALTRWGLMALLVTSAALVSRPDWTRQASAQLVQGPLTVDGGSREIREVDTLVADLALTLDFPSYLSRQRRQIGRTGGDFSAITGTRVTLTGRLVEPALNAMLELESDPGSRWPLSLDAAGIVRGGLLVGSSDRYRFVASSPHNELIRERAWRVVDAREDAAPTVRLLLPERDLEVNPSDAVPMVFEATDDHGLDQVELVIQRTDGGDAERQHVRDASGERTANGPTTLSVNSLRLLPGEAVDVWFEATDRNEIAPPGRGRSASRRITIFSPEAEHAERLTELDALIDALILLLAGRLESPVYEGGTVPLPVVVEAQQVVSGATAIIIRGFEVLVGAMSTDTLASAPMLNSVRELLDALSTHHELEGAQLRLLASGGGMHRRPTQLRRVLAEHNEEGVTLVERAAWTLKDLLDVARQEQVLAQGRDLLDGQRELMKQLQEMKANGTDNLSPEARRTLDELDATLSRMEEELGRLMERSPYENQNLTHEPSGDEQDVRSLRERLAEVRKLMAEGRHDEAMALLEELQRETQEMMAALQGDFDLQAPKEETAQALSEFDLRLGELTNEQAGLTRETEDEEQRLDAETRSAIDAQLKQAMDKARELAARLEQTVGALAPSALHPTDREVLAELKERTRQTREAVERLEHEMAREQAHRVERESHGLSTEVGESEARTSDKARRDKLRAIIQGLNGSEALAAELVSELNKVKPRTPRPGAERRKQATRLEKRQQRLERAMGGLEEQLDGVEQTLPGIGETLGPAMKEARDAMQKASGELGETKPGEAAGHQRRAMERLGAIKQAIDKRLRDSPGRPDGGPGIHRRDQRVEIPDTDGHRSPKALREELLKAMKERAPEHYEDANERYYEELVR